MKSNIQLYTESQNKKQSDNSTSQSVDSARTALKRPLSNVEAIPNPNEVPSCLKKLVCTIVRSFYSREHSLITDLLVRNTIMNEDDLCARLHFERKQLRQNLHTLKVDQFIKSKLQLETDADGKTAKITHYFIDYKLFVNVVKYRLDLMQRRLEAEQRQTTSRALFKCSACGIGYTDLDVGRIFNPEKGNLVCTYCRAEVLEEEDNAQHSNVRALVANFHQNVRQPLDSMLKECDEVHLSSAILEPEIRALEPLPGSSVDGNCLDEKELGKRSDLKRENNSNSEGTITIVLGGTSNSSSVAKECPIWISESTIDSAYTAGLDGLCGLATSTTPVAVKAAASVPAADPITQTLAPGRVPSAHLASDQSEAAQQSGGGAPSSDIMQLLLVHERRGMGSHGPKPALSSSRAANSSLSKSSSSALLQKSDQLNSRTGAKRDVTKVSEERATVQTEPTCISVNGKLVPLSDITPMMVKQMSAQERDKYVSVWREMYSDSYFD